MKDSIVGDNVIFLILGKSGSGKTAVCDKVEDVLGITSVRSYTTRLPRYEGEGSHIFVPNFHEWMASHPDEKIVGRTLFDWSYYWATQAQVEASNLYVIDIDGIKYFKKNYTGNKKVRVVHITASPFKRAIRMLKRGDSVKACLSRLLHDHKAFLEADDYTDVTLENDSLDICAARLTNYIMTEDHR